MTFWKSNYSYGNGCNTYPLLTNKPEKETPQNTSRVKPSGITQFSRRQQTSMSKRQKVKNTNRRSQIEKEYVYTQCKHTSIVLLRGHRDSMYL